MYGDLQVSLTAHVNRELLSADVLEHADLAFNVDLVVAALTGKEQSLRSPAYESTTPPTFMA